MVGVEHPEMVSPACAHDGVVRHESRAGFEMNCLLFDCSNFISNDCEVGTVQRSPKVRKSDHAEAGIRPKDTKDSLSEGSFDRDKDNYL